MVRQPEDAERYNNGMNEVFAPDLFPEPGLSEAAENAHVTPHYDRIWSQEANRCLKGVLENHLFINDNVYLS